MEIINTTPDAKEKKKFQKSLVFDYEMKDVLKKEAQIRGMTVAGFIKYCIMKEINK